MSTATVATADVAVANTEPIDSTASGKFITGVVDVASSVDADSFVDIAKSVLRSLIVAAETETICVNAVDTALVNAAFIFPCVNVTLRTYANCNNRFIDTLNKSSCSGIYHIQSIINPSAKVAPLYVCIVEDPVDVESKPAAVIILFAVSLIPLVASFIGLPANGIILVN